MQQQQLKQPIRSTNSISQPRNNSLFKGYNNYVIGNPTPCNVPLQMKVQTGPNNVLSKSTLSTLEKLRNVRSLTPEKQQVVVNPQYAAVKAQQQNVHQHQLQTVSSFAQNSSPHSTKGSTGGKQKKIVGQKKYSLATGKSRLNSGRLSSSKSPGPSAQGKHPKSYQFVHVVGSNQRTPNEEGASNSLLDNLSTLRSSDINEREKNLLEKVKHYKKENQKLIKLLKDSETMVGERIQSSKKETEQILRILDKLWPLLSKIVKQEGGDSLDTQTKEILGALGQLLGKDMSESLKNQKANTLSDSKFSETHILKKETDFLKLEINKVRSELDKTSKHAQLFKMKSDVLQLQLSQMAAMSDLTNHTLYSYNKDSQLQDKPEEPAGFLKALNLGSLVSEEEQGVPFEEVFKKFNQLEQELKQDVFSPVSAIFSPQVVGQESRNGVKLKQSPYVMSNQGPAQSLQQSSSKASGGANMPLPKKIEVLPGIGGAVQQPKGENTNLSLPDISSSEIGPNKVVKINNLRGNQLSQRQRSNNNQSSINEELGHSQVKIVNDGGTHMNNRINMKNNLAMLRNRSTSPNISHTQQKANYIYNL